jgi:hypothetical protein
VTRDSCGGGQNRAPERFASLSLGDPCVAACLRERRSSLQKACLGASHIHVASSPTTRHHAALVSQDELLTSRRIRNERVHVAEPRKLATVLQRPGSVRSIVSQTDPKPADQTGANELDHTDAKGGSPLAVRLSVLRVRSRPLTVPQGAGFVRRVTHECRLPAGQLARVPCRFDRPWLFRPLSRPPPHATRRLTAVIRRRQMGGRAVAHHRAPLAAWGRAAAPEMPDPAATRVPRGRARDQVVAAQGRVVAPVPAAVRVPAAAPVPAATAERGARFQPRSTGRRRARSLSQSRGGSRSRTSATSSPTISTLSICRQSTMQGRTAGP